MNDMFVPAPVRYKAARPQPPVRLADLLRRPHGLASLRTMIATWDAHKRFRWKLEQMLKDNPHLIDDIGLTKRQVEAEIAKPFWQR